MLSRSVRMASDAPALPAVRCPRCDAVAPDLMPHADAIVPLFRCRICRHVWVHRRIDLEEPPALRWA